MKTALLSLILAAAQLQLIADDKSGYVAHEWGTFTSVQGADGVQLEWNPFVAPELPKFVYDRNKPSGEPRRQFTAFPGKTAWRTLQRMETPVIYFYSDEPKTVDVTVKFPQGLVTEWYPQAQDIGPSVIKPSPVLSKLDNAVGKTGLQPNFTFASLDQKATAQSLIRWSGIEVLPPKQTEAAKLLAPFDHSGSHYYAARETDADMLRIKGYNEDGSSTPQHEKFLFYRGVGFFTAPLQVRVADDFAHRVNLKNNGKETLAHLYVLTIHDGRGNYVYVDKLAPGASRTVTLDPDRNTLPTVQLTTRISTDMAQSLTKEGLYAREASAMVKTWRDSWFEEPGVRVLYTLPEPWTSQILPINIEPKPQKLTRVFVGRAEVITPAMEKKLQQELTRYFEGSEQARKQAIENVRQSGLGRFTEPAMRRVLANNANKKLQDSGWQLVSEAMRRAPDSKPLAQR